MIRRKVANNRDGFHPYLALSKYNDWECLISLYNVTAYVAVKDAPLVIDKGHPHGGGSEDTQQSLGHCFFCRQCEGSYGLRALPVSGMNR